MLRLFFIVIVAILLAYIQAAAQVKPAKIKDCGTKAPLIKPVITAEKKQRAAERTQYSSPYPVKVFIRVFANDDGSNLAASETDVLRQFANMRNFYQSHDICFILVGYDIIRHSDLNNMNVTEGDDLADLEGFVFSSMFTVFVHAGLTEGSEGQNGYAYDIPNHFLSIVRSAIESTTNTTTLAHEMGHCLGLLHTFEPAYGNEAVARSGDCRDCEDEGDLLCDTQADLNTDDDMINSNCVYFGSATDECNMAYLMEERNIMTYGDRACRDHFTNGQGIRARVFLLDDHENRIAENALVLGSASFVAGLLPVAARNSITFLPGSSFTISAGASAVFSSRLIVFSPGADLRPAGGYVHASASGVYCQ